MKRVIILLIAVLVTATLSSQEINGKFLNYNNQVIKINIGGCDQEALKINSDGSFVFKPIIRELNQRFSINLPNGMRIPILVSENQKVNVIIDLSVNSGSAVKFSGDRKEINIFLDAWTNELGTNGWIKNKNYNSFVEYSADVEKLNKMLDKLLNKIKGDKELVRTFKIQKDVDIVGMKLRYGTYDKDKLCTEKEYVAFMNSINLDDPIAYEVDSHGRGSIGYMGVVERRISWEERMRRTPQDDPKDAFIRKLDILGELVKNQDVKNAVSNYYSIMYYMGGGGPNAPQFAESFFKVNNNPKDIEFIKERLKAADKKPLSPGSIAPNFEMEDINGNIVKLSDFKDKLVYLDVWATWCGPCVAEIPFMEKIYNHFKGDNRIAIISISVDENLSKWKEKIAADKPEWGQYRVNGFENTLCKEYLISGVPRFMMFDGQGNIININAQRPSSPEIISIIEKELNKPKTIQLPGMTLIKR